MEGFLRSLQHLVVSMHGFEHGYAKFSRFLLDAQDPFNQRGTVGGFDEFADQSFDQIVAKLREVAACSKRAPARRRCRTFRRPTRPIAARVARYRPRASSTC